MCSLVKYFLYEVIIADMVVVHARSDAIFMHVTNVTGNVQITSITDSPHAESPNLLCVPPTDSNRLNNQ